jgi:protein-S-isoprenylcysteine O-methyltransferase Ste14
MLKQRYIIAIVISFLVFAFVLQPLLGQLYEETGIPSWLASIILGLLSGVIILAVFDYFKGGRKPGKKEGDSKQ